MTAPRPSLSPSQQQNNDAVGLDLVAELQRRVQGEVRFDRYSRMLYSTDASLYQIWPVGVVIPRHIDDVQATLEIAARHRIPVLPRGSGSSLAGQAVGAAIVIDLSKYLDKVIHVDPEARTVTTQPGMVLANLNKTLSKYKLMVGPDPASAERASIGGTIGNNATGSHSILYGMMADNVVSARVFLADASSALLEPLDADGVAAKARLSSLEGRIYAQAPEIVQRVTPEIITRWPKHWRRASGYNLDRLAAALLPPEQRGQLSADSRFRPDVCNPVRIDRFNLAQLLTGSEGTLAVMTEVTVNLVPTPARTGLAVIHFDDVIASCAAVPDILETAPSAAELMDRQMIALARLQPEWARKLHFVEGDPAAIMVTEYYGSSEAELVSQIEHLEKHLRRRGFKGTIIRVLDPARVNDVWSVRKAGLNILMSRRGDLKPVPGIEDVSVPQERLADYISELLDFCVNEQKIPEVGVYAHASAGCLHVRPLLNMKDKHDVELLQIMGDFATNLCIKYSGAMSGEHGDGLARSAFNPRLFGPTLYGAMQEMKQLFDPHNLMNPGKIVDAGSPLEHLRMGPTYQTITLDTVFDWGSDGGYAPAIEMCNGAAVCRKLGAGTMCPSYMATKDEHDTTRARANALRNALSGFIPADELFSPEMYGVMDLCLGCKACKSECPSSVDMAKIKSEYLVHYYRHNGLPLFNRMMGLLPSLNALLYKVAPGLTPLINWGLRSPVAKNILARIGVHPARTLPEYGPKTFETWFGEHLNEVRNSEFGIRNRTPHSALPTPHSALPTPHSVILFHDTWTNYNERSIGMATVRVLEAAGYTVYLAAGRECCGRPLITGGQADKAKAWVDHNVALLAPYANQGIPIVGIEPSCILTLRDEYIALASDQKRARILAANALTFEEFVVREAAAGHFAPAWRSQPGKALLHGHCHHKALVGNEPSVAALKLAGYTVEVIPSGCCGMAGDFGYEASHYEISRAIGEERLFPAVRAAAPEATVVASGTSCRHQIEHFTGRHPVHLVEALAAALQKNHGLQFHRARQLKKIPVMNIHDSGYKRLFSNRTIFRQLVESFVEEAWVSELDFNQAERIDKSFVSEHYKETESDLIYKVPLQNSERVVYFYVLIEFQSTVQRFMAVRILHYVGSFYLDYVQTQEGAKLLPPIFPIVLYNGEETWNAPVQVADLIEPYPTLGPHGVRLQYFKIAENEYSREALLAMRNIIATLFLAEAHYDIQVLYGPIVSLFESETDRQAIQIFMNWFEQLVVHGYRPASEFAVLEREYASVEEVKSMLIKAIERDREQLIRLGEARGEVRGEARGEAKAKAERNRQVVLAMHKRDFDLALIAEIVGLTAEEVTAILNQPESAPLPRRKRRSANKKK